MGIVAPPRGSTLCGLEDPFCRLCPRSKRCGSARTSTTRVAQALSTEGASKLLEDTRRFGNVRTRCEYQTVYMRKKAEGHEYYIRSRPSFAHQKRSRRPVLVPSNLNVARESIVTLVVSCNITDLK